MTQGNDEFGCYLVTILTVRFHANSEIICQKPSLKSPNVHTARQTGLLKKLPRKHGDFGV
jgi:hypothetical protein